MLNTLRKNRYIIALLLAVSAYITYFSFFTILRYNTMWAHYFDLGIMHQTVYNSFRAIQTQDWSRFLELTNPYGPQQIKRMSIHNDIILGILSLFYFIHPGPETLLVIQTVVLGTGALAVFGIARHVLNKNRHCDLISFVFALSYLLYSPMQRANIFEFHAVALATSGLLFMYYFWLKKRYWISLLFFVLTILTKEEVPLTTFFFAAFIIIQPIIQVSWKKFDLRTYDWRKQWFAFTVLLVSLGWFLLSLLVIIPMSRGGNHFALSYYGDFGDSPTAIFVGLLKNPFSISKYIFHIDTFRYLYFLFGPLGFLSLFAPQYLLIALPEFGINLLSNNWNMRNIVFHYTSVIQPFVFIASLYGFQNTQVWISKRWKSRWLTLSLVVWVCVWTVWLTFTKGPLPLSKEQDLTPMIQPKNEALDARQWRFILRDENLKISSTGKLAPLFTSRRYFYTFSDNYRLADYVIIYLYEVDNDFLAAQQRPAYDKLVEDPNYQLVYKKDDLEVYKKK